MIGKNMASKFCTFCNADTNQKLVFEPSKWHTQEVAFKKEKDRFRWKSPID